MLSDGRIEVEGQTFNSPSQAGIFVRKKSTNGWNFWRLEPNGGQPLRNVRGQYLRMASPGSAEADAPGEVAG